MEITYVNQKNTFVSHEDTHGTSPLNKLQLVERRAAEFAQDDLQLRLRVVPLEESGIMIPVEFAYVNQ